MGTIRKLRIAVKDGKVRGSGAVAEGWGNGDSGPVRRFCPRNSIGIYIDNEAP